MGNVRLPAAAIREPSLNRPNFSICPIPRGKPASPCDSLLICYENLAHGCWGGYS
jgi:hypothetical protein